MARRWYICDVLGTGSESDPFRPAVDGVLTPPPTWNYHDCRADPTSAAGEMLAEADVTDGQHGLLAGTAGVTWIPFADDAGDPLGVTAPLGELSTANRSAIQTGLENRHVPLQGLSLTDQIYVIIRRYLSRCRIRQWLTEHDYTELLDNTVSSIPGPKRNAIKSKLEARGFDLSGVTGSTTVREALRLLIVQDNVAF